MNHFLWEEKTQLRTTVNHSKDATMGQSKRQLPVPRQLQDHIASVCCVLPSLCTGQLPAVQECPHHHCISVQRTNQPDSLSQGLHSRRSQSPCSWEAVAEDCEFEQPGWDSKTLPRGRRKEEGERDWLGVWHPKNIPVVRWRGPGLWLNIEIKRQLGDLGRNVWFCMYDKILCVLSLYDGFAVSHGVKRPGHEHKSKVTASIPSLLKHAYCSCFQRCSLISLPLKRWLTLSMCV